MITDETSPQAPRNTRPGAVVLALTTVLMLAGLGVRIAPLFDGEAFMQHWPTEDGYLMLTVSRNMALGDGMSVSDGEIPTNGVQPLTTLLWVLGYLPVDGDPVDGVWLVLWMELLIAVASAYLLWRLALQVVGEGTRGQTIACLVTAVWFTSPLVVHHSMNCLETGLYTLTVLAAARVFAERGSPPALWSIRKCLAVGVLLGLVFWSRNDGVFLILAACLTYLWAGRAGGLDVVKARFYRTLVFGATSVAVALPWLVFNQTRFGSIMPVSGRAESLGASFGHNFPYLPANLVEYLSLVFAIPSQLEPHPVVLTVSLLIVAATAAIAIRSLRHSAPPAATLTMLVLLYGAGLFLFYGLFFGAAHFTSRYMFPLSPFFALGTVVSLDWVGQRLGRFERPAQLATAVVVLAVMLGLHVRHWDRARPHMHFQVVQWTQENVPDEAWMGAAQTGTLGYFHPRTLNLDGKVNPQAYEARVAGTLHQYVVASPIAYLVDWVDPIRDMSQGPVIAKHFEVVVLDEANNLGALRRKGEPPTKSPAPAAP